MADHAGERLTRAELISLGVLREAQPSEPRPGVLRLDDAGRASAARSIARADGSDGLVLKVGNLEGTVIAKARP